MLYSLSNNTLQYDITKAHWQHPQSTLGSTRKRRGRCCNSTTLALSQTRVQLEKLIKLAMDDLASFTGEYSTHVGQLLNWLQEILEVHNHLEKSMPTSPGWLRHPHGRRKWQCFLLPERILVKQIYNLIAQMQNEVNLEIASNSKKVSAAAKRDNSSIRQLHC